MTTPQLALLAFAGWTILMVLLIGFHRWKCVFTGTVPKGGFPSDVVPEEGFYRRVLQAHKNCVENLGVFAAIVLVLTARGLDTPALDTLAMAVIGARVIQSLIHLSTTQTRPVAMTRFTFFLVQVVAFVWMGLIAWQA